MEAATAAWRMHSPGDEQRVPGDVVGHGGGGGGPLGVGSTGVKERKVDDFTALYSMEPPPVSAQQPRSSLTEPTGER